VTDNVTNALPEVVEGARPGNSGAGLTDRQRKRHSQLGSPAEKRAYTQRMRQRNEDRLTPQQRAARTRAANRAAAATTAKKAPAKKAPAKRTLPPVKRRNAAAAAAPTKRAAKKTLPPPTRGARKRTT
jgi:hypothetical protein